MQNYVYEQYIQPEPFVIQTAHSSTERKGTAIIPVPPTFRSPSYHQVYKFDFSPKYDGLIGIDLLRCLGATIDTENEVIKTKNAIIPIQYMNEEKTPIFHINVAPRTEQVIKFYQYLLNQILES